MRLDELIPLDPTSLTLQTRVSRLSLLCARPCPWHPPSTREQDKSRAFIRLIF